MATDQMTESACPGKSVPPASAFALPDERRLGPCPTQTGVVEAEHRFWLIVHEPGKVPDRKGPWPYTETKRVLREFIAANPTAYLHVLTQGYDGPWVQHGPELLQMMDGRSMGVGRKHNQRTKIAHDTALASAKSPGQDGAWRVESEDRVRRNTPLNRYRSALDRIANYSGGTDYTCQSGMRGIAKDALEVALPATGSSREPSERDKALEEAARLADALRLQIEAMKPEALPTYSSAAAWSLVRDAAEDMADAIRALAPAVGDRP